VKNETRVKLLEAQTALDAAQKAALAEAVEVDPTVREHIVGYVHQFSHWRGCIENMLNPRSVDYQGALIGQYPETRKAVCALDSRMGGGCIARSRELHNSQRRGLADDCEVLHSTER
jgi:hypothetical protein